MTGADMVRIPYKGAGPSVIALVGGEAHLMFRAPGSVMPHVKAGRLRALAVTTPSRRRWCRTCRRSRRRCPATRRSSIIGMFAPAKTPPAIVNLLQQEIARGVNSPR